MTTLALTGGTVIASVDPVSIVTADVLVDDGRIAAIGDVGAAGARVGVADASVDCAGCLIVPGNVCAHTHAYAALSRGMPSGLEPPTDFVEVLRRIWWRLDRALDPASIRASALVAGMEALLAGTTTLIDHHASPAAIDGSLDILAETLGELGIRSILCYETSDRDGPAAAASGLNENLRFARRVAAGDVPLSRAMVGAHASFTLSDATLARCAEAASSAGVGIHVHAAEDAADERDSLDRSGIRVVERLARAGALDERTLLAHGVWLDEAEVERVSAAGATVVHNARSNMNNRVGHAPVGRLGPRVALGTDGIGADMLEESRAAYLRGREAGSVADARWALERLAEGARSAGRSFGEPGLGRIELGAPADLVVLDYDPPTPLSPSSFPGHWIFGLSARAVRDVVVAGRLVVRDRHLTGVEADAIVAGARAEAARLWARLETVGEHPFRPGAVAVR